MSGSLEPSQPSNEPMGDSPAPVVPAMPANRRRSRMDVALVLAAMIAIGGAAFAAGRVTAPTVAASAAQDCGPGGGGNQAGPSGQPEPANPAGNAGQ